MLQDKTQIERRIFLIQYLISENPRYKEIVIPQNEVEQKQLLRSLMNVRPAKNASEEFFNVQNAYLIEENKRRGITNISDLKPICDDFYLWRGDITTLKIGAIVNAANSGMTGCYQPCHSCIDNCIHTFAGIQLRAECAKIMEAQGHEEPTGQAKITKAFNLPCDFVLHTVGPIVGSSLSENDCRLLSSCYTSCLDLANKNVIESIAFCCISTGVFRFPHEKAAEIAVSTAQEWKNSTKSKMKILFNVFSEKDEKIYKQLFPNR